ncbi:UV DNA damage repair endonuclease UvsE [Paenibacillus humicola]|uniref:UV DNA damage repair endonuclease UvsE n=1 Tax=Paenibacillus humicola TaxID=3110540 RepID=UPI00237B372A|nr:UV DNA damage repair endonuclease UvsE [Paenibacillus humicola]
MIVRFGFVAMSMQLTNASPSKTMTFKSFSGLADREAGLRRLERIAGENLHNTLRLLRHCAAHGIGVYRFSSKLIPLLTHEELRDWSPWPALSEPFADIGAFVKEKGMRVSFHPDHFCVFSTPRPEVLVSSKRDMEYHVRMLEAMGLDERAKCNIHIGGAYGDKAAAGERFVRQLGGLPDQFRSRITLENDDKTFTARETLEAAEAAQTPMVLDIHHHAVNGGGETEASLLGDLWPRIVRTWEREAELRRIRPQAGQETGAGTANKVSVGQDARPAAVMAALADAAEDSAAGQAPLPPKLHASSPKSAGDPRGHADYVETGPLVRFLRETAGSVPALDCMLEAKLKDEALFKLMDDMRALEAAGEGIRVVDGGTIEVR